MTPDSCTPSGSSSCTSIRGSKESIQWCRQSISNSSVHTTSTTNDKDSVYLSSRDSLQVPLISSGSSRNQNSSGPDPKSCHSLEKSTFCLRNESQSSISTILGSKPDDHSTTPTPKQGIRILSPPSIKDEDGSSPSSTPRASLVSTLTLETDPIPSSTPGPCLLAPQKTSFLLSSDRDEASFPVSSTSPRPFKTDNVDLVDPGPPPIHAIVTAGPSTPSVPIAAFFPPPTDRDPMGTTTSRSRTSTVATKGKKGMLGFMTDFLNSNKRPEITTPHNLVHLTHVDFNPSIGEFLGLPKEWQQFFQDSGISKSDQEKNPLAVMEVVDFYQEGGGDVWDKMGHAATPGGSQSPPVLGTAQSARPGVSKSVDDSVVPTVSLFRYSSSGALADSSKRPQLSLPKKAHPSGGPNGVSPSHPPAAYRPAPSPSQPVQPNLERSTSQQAAPKPPRNDALVRTNTMDWRSPAPPAAVKASTRESPNASTADLPSKSQFTTAVNAPVAERRAPQPPTAPRQQSAAAVSLVKPADATPRRQEKGKEDKANDANIVKRLQQICTDADPTQLYRNLVKIGQG